MTLLLPPEGGKKIDESSLLLLLNRALLAIADTDRMISALREMGRNTRVFDRAIGDLKKRLEHVKATIFPDKS